MGRLRLRLSQLVLQPAPDDWADGFQPLTRPPDVHLG